MIFLSVTELKLNCKTKFLTMSVHLYVMWCCTVCHVFSHTEGETNSRTLFSLLYPCSPVDLCCFVSLLEYYPPAVKPLWSILTRFNICSFHQILFLGELPVKPGFWGVIAQTCGSGTRLPHTHKHTFLFLCTAGTNNHRIYWFEEHYIRLICDLSEQWFLNKNSTKSLP